jgi:hypothetical protein
MRARHGPGTVAGMSTSRGMRVIVDIERTATTVSGQIAVSDGTPVAFFGWLDLIDRLERAAGLPGPGPGVPLAGLHRSETE